MTNKRVITINEETGSLTVKQGSEEKNFDIGSPEAFSIISSVYLRSGWDNKYVYSFSWLGRPIIQLPDDLMRIQELIYSIKPDFIIEIGVAHGGSLVFSASLCHAIGKGQVIGIDVDIREHNRKAIEEHEMFPYISLIEGDSIAQDTFQKVKEYIKPADKVLVFLDGCHTKKHVYEELKLYSELVSIDSYIVAMDGIMQDLVDAPRSQPDWATNNPTAAACDFVAEDDRFIIDEPLIPFNEGAITTREPTYFPQAFLKRIK